MIFGPMKLSDLRTSYLAINCLFIIILIFYSEFFYNQIVLKIKGFTVIKNQLKKKLVLTGYPNLIF